MVHNSDPTHSTTRPQLPPVRPVDWPGEARRLAGYVLKGETKKACSLAGRYRLWTQATETEIRVGRHGKGQPLVVLRQAS